MNSMRQFALGLIATAVIFGAAPAVADQAHSWISSTGSGSTCTRAAPCATLALALTATQAGGVISLLDSVDLPGSTFIGKSLTLRAESVDAGITYAGPGGPFIGISAGSADVVTLDGLHFNGATLLFSTAAHLVIINCVFSNLNFGGQAAIAFTPAGASQLSVANSVFTNNGNGTGGGLVIKPGAGGSARVNLERVTVDGNAFGIAADGSTSTAGINLTIADSMVGGNSQDGIVATSGGGAPIGVMVKNTRAVNNAIGVRSIGPNVTVRLDQTTVIGNGTGLSFAGGGALLSFGNNDVEANGSNGVFSGNVALK